MSISVILPTYNRAEVLRKTLKGYAEQRGEHQMLEVLVVDDGSKDHTASVVEDSRQLLQTPIRYLRQENRGLAAARNHGFREARGELILFGDDDIIPSREMVAQHVGWHCKHPEPNMSVLGYVRWAPELRPTPFMIWSGLYGPQFHFGYFKPDRELEFWHAYFCNTSVKSGFLRKNGLFSETFRQYGWEDIELSYRLYQKGYKLFFSPEAFGYHYKYEKFADTLRRVRELNGSSVVFANTEAGKYFFEQVSRTKTESTSPVTAVVKGLLRPLKKLMMPLIRCLLDTQIPLPNSLYERVMYYYTH